MVWQRTRWPEGIEVLQCATRMSTDGDMGTMSHKRQAVNAMRWLHALLLGEWYNDYRADDRK